MRIDLLPVGLVLAATLQFFVASEVTAAGPPRVGESAPEFSFVGTDELAYHSTDYFDSASRMSEDSADAAMEAMGKARAGEPGRGVVIAWFPKAFTSG